MKKKVCSICLIVLVVLSLCTMVSAADGRVYFTDLIQNATSVSVKARYEGTDTQNVYLIVAYTNKTTGVIEAISSDMKAVGGTEETLTVSLEDKSSTADLKCFLWDAISGRTPLDNVAPAPVTGLASDSRTTDSVSLSWAAAEDDHQSVASYEIYNMGMKVGNTASTAFTDTHLERGSENHYEVITVDSEGLVSPESVALTMAAANIPTTVCAGAVEIGDGRLKYVIDEGYSRYGSSAATTADGLACRRTVNPLADGLGTRDIVTRHPFNFSAEYAKEVADVSDFTLILTYFDDASGQITVEYCKRGGSGPDSYGSSVRPFTTGNTGQWKTAVFTIGGADFSQLSTSEGNSYGKIRIYAPGKDFKIYSLSVVPTTEYETMMKNAVARVTDAYINDGILLNLDASGEVFKEKIAEQGGIFIPGGKALECDVTSLVTAADASVFVELEYYTETEGEEVVLAYNSQSGGAAKQVTQEATATGKWQRMRFSLTDAAFSNAIAGTQLTGGADFTIGSGSGTPLYIHSVRVFKP